MKENSKACFWCCTDLLFLSPFVCFLLCLSSGSDPGLFLRFLGWQQARMLDEGRDALEVFPQAVHLPAGHQHQPVLPYHHPASGTWTNIIVTTSSPSNEETRTLILLCWCVCSGSCTSSRSQTWTARWTASASDCLPQPTAWWSALLLWKASTWCSTAPSGDWASHSATVQV